MNSKNFRLVMFLLLIAFAVVGVSGFGGSSHSFYNSTTNENGGEGGGGICRS